MHPALDILDPTNIVVYGMALDFCVAYSIKGFLEKHKFNITLAEDATKAISSERQNQFLNQWRSQGVRIARTADILREL
jgi:nicotinamidase-related amidase